MKEYELRLKLKKGYLKFEEFNRSHLQRKFEQATDEQIEHYMKEEGIDNPDEDLVSFEINRRADVSVKWLMNVSDEKLFEMAQWNQNTKSHLVVEYRFGVKLDRTQKRRIPQLKELAKKHNINFRGGNE